MKPAAALWRLAISGVVAVILLILIANVLTQPVAAPTRSYTAEFTDASGLHLDADVRVRGVRVGKVDSVELERRNRQSIAAVEFTLDKRYGITSATRLAIKYQALTGLRYVDVMNPSEMYSPAALVTNVPTAMTQPSFDITALFNGLQPVLATLSPAEINTFTANAVSYLSGDGGGLAPVLDSLRKLTKFVSNRQQVVGTLMRNLSELATSTGGDSQDLIQILDWLNRPIGGALDALDEFRTSDLYGPDYATSLKQVLDAFGIKPDINIDAALDQAFTNVDNILDTFKLVPVMWGNVSPPPQPDAPLPCSRGRAQLPEQMDVLLNGQRVILCNR